MQRFFNRIIHLTLFWKKSINFGAFEKKKTEHSSQWVFSLIRNQTRLVHSGTDTRESDVKALVGHGEVGDESDLGAEVSKQAGFDGGREDGACESSHGFVEAPVLHDEQVIMWVFQVEGVKKQLYPCGIADKIKCLYARDACVSKSRLSN